MAFAGVCSGILIGIGENQHTARYINVIGPELLGIAVCPPFTMLAVLVIVKIQLLTLALLYFPLIFDITLAVFTSKRLHTPSW